MPGFRQFGNLGNLAFIWAALSAYPKLAPVVNRGAQAGLGNETEWQIPESVDEAVAVAAFEVGKGVVQSSWTFQVLTVMMTCGNLIGLLRLVVDIFTLIFMVTPYIVSAVKWVVRKVSAYLEARRRPVVYFAPVLSPRGVRARVRR